LSDRNFSTPDSDLAAHLGLTPDGRPKRRWRRWLYIGGPILLLLGGYLGFCTGGHAVHYVTQKAARGALKVTISATGTLAPRDQVDVGAEVSGKIDSLYVDFNDHVKKGQLLAHINTDQLVQQLGQARATLAQADATLLQSSQTAKRFTALMQAKALTAQQLDSARGDLARANAGVAMAKAQVAQDETLIKKADIYAPIDGVVLDRKVSAGQTVVAAMTTPVLFTLASDLSQMELDVDIDEADVGQAQQGKRASFTVDAYPTRRFAASLISIHNAPQTVQGVVTYKGVLLVANPDGLLKPGMTATAEIDSEDLQNVLTVPNAALRFVPTDEAKAGAPPQPVPQNGVNWGRVWTENGSKLLSHDLKLGATDGRSTQVLSGNIAEGDAVITDTAGAKSEPVKN
jgi:HlyD family secretion protein